MPIRKFDRIFGGDGLYTGKHETVVECDECGKHICFDTEHSFGGTYQPPEVEQNGFTKILKPDGYDFICKDHVKGNAMLNQEERLAACADLAKTYEQGWEEADKLIRYGAEQERTRIIDLINGRMSIHNEFINDCVKHDVRVSDSFFIALSELRSILRVIDNGLVERHTNQHE